MYLKYQTITHLLFAGFVASLPLFQRTPDNEFFDDDPYWNVSNFPMQHKPSRSTLYNYAHTYAYNVKLESGIGNFYNAFFFIYSLLMMQIPTYLSLTKTHH